MLLFQICAGKLSTLHLCVIIFFLSLSHETLEFIAFNFASALRQSDEPGLRVQPHCPSIMQHPALPLIKFTFMISTTRVI